MLFRSAKRDAIIGDDPAEFIDGVKDTARGARRPFTIDELRAVFDVADPEWQSMILFGLYTGQRLGDLARLTWANVDLPKGQVRLTTSKTHKTLVIPLADALLRHVESLPNSDDPHAPIHPRAYGVISRQGGLTGNLSNQFADLLAQAGLRTYEPHRSQAKGRNARREPHSLSFHALRHTATTLLHEAGVPAAVVQALIGHSIARRYINTTSPWARPP